MSAIPHTRSRIPGKIDNKAISIWSPVLLPGVYGWYDPDSLGLSDDDPVASWPSTLATTLTWTQATGGKQPLLKTNILNGHSVVRFDGSDDSLISPNLGMTTGNLFFVVRFATSLPDRRFWSAQAGGFSGSLMFAGTSFAAVTGVGGTTAIWTTPAINTWYVLAIEHAATTITVYVNGASVGSINQNSTYGVIGLCETLLGSYGTCTAADIATFGIVKGAALSSDNRAEAEQYLMARFGISA